jgi:hypothetical protein
LAATVNTDLFDNPYFLSFYTGSIEERIKTLDAGAHINLMWAQKINEKDPPRLSGIHIKWSKEYQDKNNCEPELLVDIASLLFKV